MNRLILSAAVFGFLCASTAASAVDKYNEVPAGDAQFKGCLAYAKKVGWEGGDAASPIPDQSKVVAYCSCMWNETPDDFKGSLGKFADSDKGKATNKTCEKYSDWGA